MALYLNFTVAFTQDKIFSPEIVTLMPLHVQLLVFRLYWNGDESEVRPYFGIVLHMGKLHMSNLFPLNSIVVDHDACLQMFTKTVYPPKTYMIGCEILKRKRMLAFQ